MRKVYDFLEQDTRAAAITRILVSTGFVLLIWQLMAMVVTNRLLLVPPAEVASALLKEFQQGSMATNAWATVTAVVTSFLVSVVIGIGIGLALASSRFLSLTGGPVLSALNSVPIIALAPLFVAWLGLGFASKFVLVLLVAVFPVVVTTEAGLRATDKPLIEAARSFNATRLQIFSTVTFPYALPFIVSGIRVAWARALVGIVVAEFFGSFAGFGFAIMSASQTFDTARVLGYVIVLGAMGLIGSVAFAALERHLAPWRLE
ncbi:MULTISPECIES: ABC transporter permease [unclassified Beijerinckia]|uniref:ABC transporter permease n=1 Tax=unclassified Beijerinckia TaxID=2638183 RepID=UPI000899E300|nr:MULTISPECIES: ABC transporter permease [unclassified Beijerinckia]MDH7799687.1 ABC-type nitrate/sulfonate/bicarbonate transport system permease component [Beijerinckia sp. GAS462]SEB49440.1 NitT/TauT family transport system permease protein [Beijerinckia sp. 28-YEA-48]